MNQRCTTNSSWTEKCTTRTGWFDCWRKEEDGFWGVFEVVISVARDGFDIWGGSWEAIRMCPSKRAWWSVIYCNVIISWTVMSLSFGKPQNVLNLNKASMWQKATCLSLKRLFPPETLICSSYSHGGIVWNRNWQNKVFTVFWRCMSVIVWVPMVPTRLMFSSWTVNILKITSVQATAPEWLPVCLRWSSPPVYQCVWMGKWWPSVVRVSGNVWFIVKLKF